MDIAKDIELYRQLREKKAELKAVYDAKRREYDRALEAIENRMLQALQEMGVNSVRTDNGTAYISQKVTYGIDSWEHVRDFILDTGMVEMLQKRPAKAVVDEYLEVNEQLPPGLSRHAELVVNVRK